MTEKPRIGVLALQGAFKLHKPHIENANAEYVEVLDLKTLNSVDALIIPGGESSTVLKLIDLLGLEKDLKDFFNQKPVWGICAGAVLMAKNVKNPVQHSFGAIDIDVIRNGYGRQLDSSEEEILNYRVSFIRAPRIEKTGTHVKILAEKNAEPIWVENEKHMVTTFHPELNLKYPSPLHLRFIQKALSIRYASGPELNLISVDI